MRSPRRLLRKTLNTQNQDSVFEHYAAEDGKLYYKDFIEQLLFREEEIESNASRLKTSSKHK